MGNLLPNSFASPLLISMAGIVGTAIFIILYHIVLVNYCGRRRLLGSGDRSSAAGRGKNGVDRNILEAIPTHSFSSKKDIFMFLVVPYECVVCLGEVEDGEMVRLLPTCRHVFHVSCIDAWFTDHTSCPICRSAIDGVREGDLTGNILPSQGLALGVQSGVRRHSVSMVMPPMEEERRIPGRLIEGLKRSLSLDLCPCSSSSVAKDTTSVRQMERVCSRVARSLSLLRIGRNNSSTLSLPY